MVSKEPQEDEVWLERKEAQGPQEVRVFQDFQDSQVLRGILDLKEEKVKHLSPGGLWVPQGILGSEGNQGEKAWMEFLELQELKDYQDLEENRP